MLTRAGLLSLATWLCSACAGANTPAVPAPAAPASAAHSAAAPASRTLSVQPLASTSSVQAPVDLPFSPSHPSSFTAPILQDLPPAVLGPVKAYVDAATALARAESTSRDSPSDKPPKALLDAQAKAGKQAEAALAALEAEDQRAKEHPSSGVLIALAAVLEYRRGHGSKDVAADSQRLREALTRAKVATQSDDPLGAEARFRLAMELSQSLAVGRPIDGMDRSATIARIVELLEPVIASRAGARRDQSLFNMALIHLQRGETSKAEGPLMTLAKGASAWRPLAQYALGTIRYREGKWADALGWFVRALDAGFAPGDSMRRLSAADAAADAALRQSAVMHKAPGHSTSERDSILALTTHEMASMRAEVLCIVALHAIRQSIERADATAATAAAQVILDRAPQSLEAPVAVAWMAAQAARRGDRAKANEWSQQLASRYAPASDWAANLRKSDRHPSEEELTFASRLAQGGSDPLQSTGLLRGAMPALKFSEPAMELQARRLVDHCLAPFDVKPAAVTLLITAASGADPVVTPAPGTALPQPALECLTDDAFAFLRQASAP